MKLKIKPVDILRELACVDLHAQDYHIYKDTIFLIYNSEDDSPYLTIKLFKNHLVINDPYFKSIKNKKIKLEDSIEKIIDSFSDIVYNHFDSIVKIYKLKK